MSVPTYDQFIAPLLRALASRPDGASIGDICEVLSKELGLSEADRAEMLPSRVQPVYRNRIGWAHDRLKCAGLSSSPRRGFWCLTQAGRDFAAKHRKLSDEQVEALANVDPDSRLRPRKEGDPSPATATPREVEPTKASPEERIDAALAELRESVARDLLDIIGRSEPSFFEQLVLDLLHAMRYGTSRSDLKRVGGSGDGGIDGIISLDKLGLEKVYIQAKRWKNSIGSPEIQGFMGALQLQGAAKGVFITTSTFTKDARAAAERARGSIVLVAGTELASLMIEHGVGVSHQALRIPKVDSDYFDEE